MLGNKYLKDVMMKTTKEGYDQYNVVANEIDKLADITNMGWDLTASEVFDKVRKISFGQGALIGAAVVGGAVAVKEIISKRKKKKSEE
jgi:hypothetical protein